jgi:pimeloyl-ACP methyl ester carboxylesterase
MTQATPSLEHVQCISPQGLHRMAYWEWGDRDNPKVLMCVHGLTRQGRDFDVLAQSLCSNYRVICPDVVGRGRSDWLRDASGYQIPTYIADMVTLIARLQQGQPPQVLHWVGTSMGGLIGMGLASLPHTPISRLVLNDVGPTLEPKALKRIARYLGLNLRWKSLDEATDYIALVSRSFGPLTREQWLLLTEPLLKRDGNEWVARYDPNIAAPFKAATPEKAQADEVLLWHLYDAITCPTLLLRGAESDLLKRETALAMTQRGPKAQLHEFEHIGHAPMLVSDDQVAVVEAFLGGH